MVPTQFFAIHFHFQTMKELFLTTITKPPEVVVNKFFCPCLFLSSCFHAVKGNRLIVFNDYGLESTYIGTYYLSALKFSYTCC